MNHVVKILRVLPCRLCPAHSQNWFRRLKAKRTLYTLAGSRAGNDQNAGKENMELLDPCPTITSANITSESLVSFTLIIIYNFELNIFHKWSFCQCPRRSN